MIIGYFTTFLFECQVSFLENTGFISFFGKDARMFSGVGRLDLVLNGV